MPCNNYDETAAIESPAEAFWNRVYQILTEIEDSLPKATMRHLDLSADGDDQESALDMKPLEYVEGLMGTLDEHDPIFGGAL